MPETQLIAPARRRITVIMLAVGAALALLVTAGIAVAAPAAAEMSARAAVTDSSDLGAGKEEAEAAVTVGRTALTEAASTVIDVDTAGVDVGAENTKVESEGLLEALDALTDDDVATAMMRPILTTNVTVQAEIVSAQSTTLRERLDTAVTKKKAEEAAAAAAAEAAAEAAALANANTPDGAKAAAQKIAADEYSWGGDQFSCLSSLWQKESGWDYQAYNPSGATGIPQALPGSKMASAGSDWATNATTQIRWGLDYISSVYGSPCSAWGHSQSMNWY